MATGDGDAQPLRSAPVWQSCYGRLPCPPNTLSETWRRSGRGCSRTMPGYAHEGPAP